VSNYHLQILAFAQIAHSGAKALTPYFTASRKKTDAAPLSPQ
jgi:hypothetical protein